MIGIIYNDSNRELMENELSSLKFQGIEDIELIHCSNKNLSEYNLLITEDSAFNFHFKDSKFILIIKEIDQLIHISDNILMIQYESSSIKKYMEEKHSKLKDVYSVVINRIPKQKLEIEPLETQDATIFYHGEDLPEDMVDELFDLDSETHYTIQFYKEGTTVVPSKKHRLSWNVTTNPDLKGIVSYKIMKEIENGCLPILLKENSPSYFKSYPFFVSLEELKNKSLMIERVKEISHFISKMTREEFSSLSNSIYNGIYINSKWKYNFFLIAKDINRHIKNS